MERSPGSRRCRLGAAAMPRNFPEVGHALLASCVLRRGDHLRCLRLRRNCFLFRRHRADPFLPIPGAAGCVADHVPFSVPALLLVPFLDYISLIFPSFFSSSFFFPSLFFSSFS